MPEPPIIELLVILASGFTVGAICRRIGAPMVVGYLVVGALISILWPGFVDPNESSVQPLAEAGVLFLLFSIGLEFSLEDLSNRARNIVIGGSVQMLLVIGPVTGVFIATGMKWQAAMLLGAAVSLSSTVLVFKALAELGEVTTPHGRRAIGILLFQDIALVPLLLLIPILLGDGAESSGEKLMHLAATSVGLVAGVLLLRMVLRYWIAPLLATQRSPELVVLFALVVLGSVTWSAHRAGLPAPIGAFAAGLVFSGNRLSGQVDALVLPFREVFAAVFFVGLGLLLDPQEAWSQVNQILLGLVGVIALKSVAAAVALRFTGLGWRKSWGTGVGLSQMGEFSFVLVSAGVSQGLIEQVDYQRTLCLALGSLILTPQLLKFGLNWATREDVAGDEPSPTQQWSDDDIRHVVVIGAGPIGQQVASRMETSGIEVCLLDVSPVNLHAFAQQGFHTVAGDATDPEVLRRAKADRAQMVVTCLPDDQVTLRVTRAVRSVNAKVRLLVRCRYLSNRGVLRKAGADSVVSEEAEAAEALLRVLAELGPQANTA